MPIERNWPASVALRTELEMATFPIASPITSATAKGSANAGSLRAVAHRKAHLHRAERRDQPSEPDELSLEPCRLDLPAVHAWSSPGLGSIH